jgi:hypothetical protein
MQATENENKETSNTKYIQTAPNFQTSQDLGLSTKHNKTCDFIRYISSQQFITI